jgi:hypothetical protein
MDSVAAKKRVPMRTASAPATSHDLTGTDTASCYERQLNHGAYLSQQW